MLKKNALSTPGIGVALFRGINVGSAKRLEMASLRALMEGLGFNEVRTLLNSGNVVFAHAGASPRDAARKIETALVEKLGVAARVMVLTKDELFTVISECPLLEVADNPSRLLVGVLADPERRSQILPLCRQGWGNERVAVGKLAVYMWCPEGVIKSKLSEAVNRILGDSVTSRNWATMLKLKQVMGD